MDTALVRRLVAEQFPQYRDLSVARVIPGGHDNRVFRVGGSLCARLPSASRYAAHLLAEYEWLPRLSGHLPLAIPQPVGLGSPGSGYPWNWTLNRWILGEPATKENIRDIGDCARQLGRFLRALQRIDHTDAPLPGEQNFHRGGDLSTYELQTVRLLNTCRGLIDYHAAMETWRRALASRWEGNPVWVHGDVAPDNLLVRDGRLHAVIDFGQLAAGDPACDLTVAWTLLDEESRSAFRTSLELDDHAWQRARGWALWKQLLNLESAMSPGPRSARRVHEVLRRIRAILAPVSGRGRRRRGRRRRGS